MKLILTYICNDISYMATGSIKVVLYYHTLFSNKVSTKVLIDQIGASQVALALKNLLANAGEVMDEGSILGQRDPLEEGMATQLVFLPEESHGQRSLEGYSSQDHKDLYTIEVIQHAHAWPN